MPVCGRGEDGEMDLAFLTGLGKESGPGVEGVIARRLLGDEGVGGASDSTEDRSESSEDVRPCLSVEGGRSEDVHGGGRDGERDGRGVGNWYGIDVA